MKKFQTALCVMALALAALGGCKARDSRASGGDGAFSILVYITGVTAGSPSYEMLAAGAQEFAEAHENTRVTVYEAGFNQAEWEEQLTSLTASGQYNLVIGSNPSLPEICANVGKRFPNQKFIITDAWLAGNPQISTWLYNQYEQSLYLGYLAPCQQRQARRLYCRAGIPAADAAHCAWFSQWGADGRSGD